MVDVLAQGQRLEGFLATEIESHTCPICYELMRAPTHSPMILFPCGHSFCAQCLQAHMVRPPREREERELGGLPREVDGESQSSRVPYHAVLSVDRLWPAGRDHDHSAAPRRGTSRLLTGLVFE